MRIKERETALLKWKNSLSPVAHYSFFALPIPCTYLFPAKQLCSYLFNTHSSTQTHKHFQTDRQTDPLLICLHYLLPCLIYCLIASLPHCPLLLSLFYTLTLQSSSSPHHSLTSFHPERGQLTVSLSTSLSLSSRHHPLNHRLLPQPLIQLHTITQ